jgi:hypothetical protein
MNPLSALLMAWCFMEQMDYLISISTLLSVTALRTTAELTSPFSIHVPVEAESESL